MNSFFAMLLTLAAALTWLRLMDFAAQRGWIASRLSRKIIHIGTGPIYVLCWLFFPPAPEARFWAALVPLAITLQFALIGFGLIKDEASVRAMSRSGDPREILRGPLYYGIVFVALTLVFWIGSPIGIVALMSMCGGDGIADLVGRKIVSPHWLWSREKSLAGSLAVFTGGLGLSLAVLAVFVALKIFPAPLAAYLPPLAGLAFLAAAVESLPYKDVDNLTVPLAVVLAGLFLLG